MLLLSTMDLFSRIVHVVPIVLLHVLYVGMSETTVTYDVTFKRTMNVQNLDNIAP